MIAGRHAKGGVFRSALRNDPAPPPKPTSPNDIALELTGRDYLSYSAVSTYQKCPLRYFFQYVADLAPETVSASLLFGGAIHAAIEAHFQAILAGDPLLSSHELVALYDEAWKAAATAPILFGKGETEETLRDLAGHVLRVFTQSAPSDPLGTILGVEEEFRGPVIPGCPDLLGRIDLIVLGDDHLRIVDFKTARTRWNDAKIQEHAPHMLLYSQLLQPLIREYGDRPIHLEWVVLTKTKSVSVDTHVLAPDPRQLARTKAVVRRVWDSIRAGHFYPSASPMNCSTCPFQKACQAWER
jgi:putative RecB family exonuclease